MASFVFLFSVYLFSCLILDDAAVDTTTRDRTSMRMRNENVTTTTMTTTVTRRCAIIFLFLFVSMTCYNFLTTATWIRLFCLAFLCIFPESLTFLM